MTSIPTPAERVEAAQQDRVAAEDKRLGALEALRVAEEQLSDANAALARARYTAGQYAEVKPASH